KSQHADGRESMTSVVPAAADAAEASPIGESRWPPALVLVAYMALNIALRVWLPSGAPVRVPWLVPSIEGVLLLVLLAGPAGLADHKRWLRRAALALTIVLVAAALWSTVLLVYDLIKGTGVTQSASKLLASGGLVWLGNNLAFALLYWLMDSGGPIARMR